MLLWKIIKFEKCLWEALTDFTPSKIGVLVYSGLMSKDARYEISETVSMVSYFLRK